MENYFSQFDWNTMMSLNKWPENPLEFYNAGPRRAAEWKPAKPDQPVADRITIPSTKQYVKEILKRYDSYKKEESRSAGKGAR